MPLVASAHSDPDEVLAVHEPVLTAETSRQVPSGTRKLVSNAAIYTVANILNSAIPFLLLPVLTRLLTPEQYGMVAIFGVLTSTFGAFAGLSVHGAVNVRYFDAEVDLPRYVVTALAILASSAAVVLGVVLAGASWLTEWTGLPLAGLALAVVAAAAQFVINIRLVLWQVRGHAVRYGAFQVGQMLLNLVLSLLLIAALGLGWEGRALGIALALSLFAVVALVTLQRAGLVTWPPSAAYAKDALRFGVPLIPHVIGSLFIASSDRLMVAGLLNVHEAGVYAAGMQIGLVIGVLADASVKAVSPWIYARLARPDDAARRTIVRLTYAYFAAIALVALVFSALAPHLLMLVGEQFRSSRDVVVYIAIGGAFSGMYLMVVNYIFFVGRNELLSAVSLAVGVLNLGLSYVLVQRSGAVGAAQAYMVSQFVMFVATWILAAKCHPMPWLEVTRRARPAAASVQNP